MNISEAIDHARSRLAEAGIPEPGREAASLLAFTSGRDRALLIAHPEYTLSDEETAAFIAAVDRRAEREPFQYIVGSQEFYGLEFAVSPAALIPRPETEILVEHALSLLADVSNPRFLEIGVGTGCISIAILKNHVSSQGVGVDISEAALDLAQKNAVRHAVEARFELLQSDVYQGVSGQFDLIVSNPPYVPAADIEGLQPEVRDHEPRIALTDGSDGLSIIRTIIADAPRFLPPGGYLLIEIGINEAGAVSQMLDAAIWPDHSFIPDLQGIPRILVARRA